MTKFTPLTQAANKSKAEKRAFRKHRSALRRGRKMLDKMGLHNLYFHYHWSGIYCVSRTDSIYDKFGPDKVRGLKESKRQVYDSDNDRYYENLEELLKEILILKLSGLGKI